MRLFNCFIAVAVFLLSAPAQAYVGPGPGLSMVGSFFGLLAGVFVALFFVLLYPIRLLIKRFRKTSPAATAEEKSAE